MACTVVIQKYKFEVNITFGKFAVTSETQKPKL